MTCSIPKCDRRAAKGSRYCGAHLEDRLEGRRTVWNGGPILPASRELERKNSAGPCPFLEPGDMSRVVIH